MSALELSQPGPGPLRMPTQTAGLPRLPAVSNPADTAIRASTAAVVLAVAGIAAYISYRHACAVVRQYGESGVTALLEPGTIDGLVYASSMVILHAARHRPPVPRLARAMLALGITASLAVNVAQGWSHGLVGAAAAAWPAVALVGSYELLAWMIRTTPGGGPDHVNQAGRRSPDRPSLPHQPVTSIPPRSPPTAPASGKASRCPSASWQHHSARPRGGGRAPGWPKPGRSQSPVNRECTGRSAATRPIRGARYPPFWTVPSLRPVRMWRARNRPVCARAGGPEMRWFAGSLAGIIGS